MKNSAIASTIGLADMAAQAGKLLDYSAHAWESFTAITGLCFHQRGDYADYVCGRA